MKPSTLKRRNNADINADRARLGPNAVVPVFTEKNKQGQTVLSTGMGDGQSPVADKYKINQSDYLQNADPGYRPTINKTGPKKAPTHNLNQTSTNAMDWVKSESQQKTEAYKKEMLSGLKPEQDKFINEKWEEWSQQVPGAFGKYMLDPHGKGFYSTGVGNENWAKLGQTPEMRKYLQAHGEQGILDTRQNIVRELFDPEYRKNLQPYNPSYGVDQKTIFDEMKAKLDEYNIPYDDPKNMQIAINKLTPQQVLEIAKTQPQVKNSMGGNDSIKYLDQIINRLDKSEQDIKSKFGQEYMDQNAEKIQAATEKFYKSTTADRNQMMSEVGTGGQAISQSPEERMQASLNLPATHKIEFGDNGAPRIATAQPIESDPMIRAQTRASENYNQAIGNATRGIDQRIAQIQGAVGFGGQLSIQQKRQMSDLMRDRKRATDQITQQYDRQLEDMYVQEEQRQAEIVEQQRAHAEKMMDPNEQMKAQKAEDMLRRMQDKIESGEATDWLEADKLVKNEISSLGDEKTVKAFDLFSAKEKSGKVTPENAFGIAMQAVESEVGGTDIGQVEKILKQKGFDKAYINQKIDEWRVNERGYTPEMAAELRQDESMEKRIIMGSKGELNPYEFDKLMGEIEELEVSNPRKAYQYQLKLENPDIAPDELYKKVSAAMKTSKSSGGGSRGGSSSSGGSSSNGKKDKDQIKNEFFQQAKRGLENGLIDPKDVVQYGRDMGLYANEAEAIRDKLLHYNKESKEYSLRTDKEQTVDKIKSSIMADQSVADPNEELNRNKKILQNGHWEDGQWVYDDGQFPTKNTSSGKGYAKMTDEEVAEMSPQELKKYLKWVDKNA